MQNILPVLCFIAGFALAWLIWHGRSAARAADLQARLETERKSADEKLALLEDTRQKLSDAFKALSADALARNNQTFLQLAGATLAKTQETARGDLELRQQAIADLVTPVRESLDKVRRQLSDLRRQNNVTVLADCVLDANIAMDALFAHDEKPDWDSVSAGAESYTGTLRRCDGMAAPGIRQHGDFRRLVDGALASLAQIPKAAETRDRDLLHRLLIELRSFDHLLAFRYG